MYGFRKESYPSLKHAATEAVQRIYWAGLMFRHGKLSPGGNNVMADNAANGFTADDVTRMAQSTDPQDNAMADIIRLRQDYARTSDDSKLQQIYDAAQVLKGHGFTMRDEPWSLGTAPQQAAQPAPDQPAKPYKFSRGFGLG